MMRNLRHDSPCRRPTCGPVEKAFVPHDRFVTGTPHRARQQFGHIPFQVLIGRNADGVLHAPTFQRLVNLRLGKGCIGTKRNFPPEFLLPLNLRQQKFFLAIGTMNFAGAQLGRQIVAVSVEEQQRMVAGRLEMPVVGALFLCTVHRNLRRIHIQHGPGL